MRINQYLAHSSGLSRRQADTAITAGRVQINGVVAQLGARVAADDLVELDGKPAHAPDYQTIVFHKPVGYVTSRRQQGATPTIYALLPDSLAELKPIGRLDRDSSGLLVLTNDGALAQRLQHPSHGKRKRYEVELDRPLTATDRQQLQQGVELSDGISKLDIRPQPNYLEVWLGEGRNRQIRRSFTACGYRVTRLHRTTMGEIELGALAAGKWRQLETPASEKHPAPVSAKTRARS